MIRLKEKILRLKLIFMFTWRFLIEDVTNPQLIARADARRIVCLAES